MILHESSGLSKVRLQAVFGMPPRIQHVLAQAGAILYIRRRVFLSRRKSFDFSHLCRRSGRFADLMVTGD